MGRSARAIASAKTLIHFRRGAEGSAVSSPPVVRAGARPHARPHQMQCVQTDQRRRSPWINRCPPLNPVPIRARGNPPGLSRAPRDSQIRACVPAPCTTASWPALPHAGIRKQTWASESGLAPVFHPARSCIRACVTYINEAPEPPGASGCDNRTRLNTHWRSRVCGFAQRVIHPQAQAVTARARPMSRLSSAFRRCIGRPGDLSAARPRAI
jgi:hypothetical protein